MTEAPKQLIEITRHGNVALLTMRAGKANALTRRLMSAIAKAFDDAADADAIVITGEGKSFSAGLALPELIDLDRAGMGELIDQLHDTMYQVLTFPRATLAAINGHAYAGGCVLAMMCDARIMLDNNAKIGLNEIALGIGLPAIVMEPVRARVPPHTFHRMVLDGRLYLPPDALHVRLIDGLAEQPAELIADSLKAAGQYAAAPVAYAQIKRVLLAPLLVAIEARRAIDREAWLDTWFTPHAQRTLREAVERITKR